ncbi:hypothetical protein BDV33DRAFT_183079 [Aspergillus novoparasiticus]|uniref:Uncharacterized protein n=1 Tax=Aspergillus novoparasiticus TaxID=986946 RepID=A0A5N6E9J0_9EURO|nr:hypothetical protein BDV33DRAFT_183079 [Aspergillus novoparasiticus]
MHLEVNVFEFLCALAFTSSRSKQSCHGHAGILLFLWFPVHRMWLPHDVGVGELEFRGDLMLRHIARIFHHIHVFTVENVWSSMVKQYNGISTLQFIMLD